MAYRQKFIDDFKHIILDTSAEDAMLLRILVSSSGLKRGVEVGTCRAFGAINMGIGFERTAGHLDTVDINHDRVVKALENLKQLSLDKTVTVIEGDALKVLPKLQGKYDFAFIDAVKKDYFKYFKSVEPRLGPGSVIVADNTIGSAKSMPDFLKYINTDPHYDAITIRATMKKGDGMSIIYKISNEKEKVDTTVMESRKKIIQAQPEGALAIDTILPRILVEASRAKRGIEIGAGRGTASINMGIAFERTGGKLVSVESDSKLAARAISNIKAAGLDRVATVSEGRATEFIAGQDGMFDFVLLNGDRDGYLKCFMAIEKKLNAGAVIVADNVLDDAADVKDFLKYVTSCQSYESVTLRPDNARQTDGVIVIYKIGKCTP